MQAKVLVWKQVGQGLSGPQIDHTIRVLSTGLEAGRVEALRVLGRLYWLAIVLISRWAGQGFRDPSQVVPTLYQSSGVGAGRLGAIWVLGSPHLCCTEVLVWEWIC